MGRRFRGWSLIRKQIGITAEEPRNFLLVRSSLSVRIRVNPRARLLVLSLHQLSKNRFLNVQTVLRFVDNYGGC